MSVKRLFVPPDASPADANILCRYAIESASWVWHRASHDEEPVVLRFTCAFEVTQRVTTRLHLSADQRYELEIDGSFVGFGPHRSDVHHWSFASYEATFEPGRHEVSALVWWLGNLAPVAQMSHRGGFIFAAEGLESQLNTGQGPWQVRRLPGYRFVRQPLPWYHVIGPRQCVEVDARPTTPESAVVIVPPMQSQEHGVIRPGWCLEPSPLPDMMWRQSRPGRMVACREAVSDAQPWGHAAGSDARLGDWNALLHEGKTLVVPPRGRVSVLWDLQDYFCGHVELVARGAGGRIDVEWSESLFERKSDGSRSDHKGQRDAWQDKLWLGFGDEYRTGGHSATLRSLWWRSGRWVRIAVTAGDEPITLQSLAVVQTRYPREVVSRFECDDLRRVNFIPLAVRGLESCSHETLMDCPYYEQLMYVGDSRLQVLAAYVTYDDDRLTRRAIELFDWSSARHRFVAERYPTDPEQLSVTFSMLWIAMVHDHALWQRDLAWTRRQLPAVRSLVEQLLALRRDDGLLKRLPGWSFCDWVPQWRSGIPPGSEQGDSSLIQLHLLGALQHAAALEHYAGDDLLAQRDDRLADATARAIRQRYWNEPRGLLADTSAHDLYSEHAQCLALLYGVLPDAAAGRCLQALRQEPDLARTTVYFSHYLFEVLAQHRLADDLFDRLAFWSDLPGQGLCTPLEQPEPSRSDCHAWGSHPLYHLHASVAGVRPMAMGFTGIRIAPLPGPLREISATMPHPAGTIRLDLRFTGDDGRRCTGEVRLPEGERGQLHWQGHCLELRGQGQGPHRIDIAARD